MRILSFGGGVQSNAVLVLAAQGRIQYDAFVFANVGEDSENPATLEYVEHVSKPFAKRHSLQFVELRKLRVRAGVTETLWEYIHRTKRSVPIPARMANGAPGNRSCTWEFKIKVINRWLKQNGASADDPATVGLGISLDEYQRMGQSKLKEQVNEYPLIDLRLSRNDCHKIISDAGLPVAPKSACFFCPFQSRYEWWDMRHNHPELFDRAVHLEQFIQAKRIDEPKKDPLWLHPDCKPLEDAVPVNQMPLFEMNVNEVCAGSCFT